MSTLQNDPRIDEKMMRIAVASSAIPTRDLPGFRSASRPSLDEFRVERSQDGMRQGAVDS